MGSWRSDDPANRKYSMGHLRFRVSDWFELKPGVPVPMEVLLGEGGGGAFGAMLCIEQEGVDYPERDIPGGGPLLPVFKTVPTPEHIVDEMSYTLSDGQVDYTGGPIFSAY